MEAAEIGLRNDTDGPRGPLMRALAAIGRPVRTSTVLLLRAVALATSVALHGLRPATWRRTIRNEFLDALQLVVLGPLRTLVVMAFLTGILLVAQAIYWLNALGQAETAFPILLLLLVRQIAPLFVGLLVLGRVGLVFLVDLGDTNARGNWRMLEAAGIDPLDYLVVPRVAALAIGNFTLSMIFVVLTLAVGYMAASFARPPAFSIWEFYLNAAETMHWRDYIAMPLKTVGIGIAVGLVCTLTGLRRSGAAADHRNLLPHGFGRAIVAIFGVSLLVDLVM